MALIAAAGLQRSDSGQAAAVYYLPWTAGQRMYVLQGQDQGTHTGPYSKYAYDFAPGPMSQESFLIRAARSGKVLEAEGSFAPGPDCDPSRSKMTNYILIDHGDGTGAAYLHLAQNSIIPRVSTQVRQGDPLAMSGKTGFVCGAPHLHFTAVDMATHRSIDVLFADPDALRTGGRLRTGAWYVASPAAAAFRTALPITTRRTATSLLGRR